MSGRRVNVDTLLDPQTKRKVEQLKRDDPEAREHFEQVRARQLHDHPPIEGPDHRPAQRANATQMGSKAVAMKFLGWP